jgi:hypothetical protein
VRAAHSREFFILAIPFSGSRCTISHMRLQERMEGMERCQETRGSLGLLIAHLLMPGWNVRTRMPVGIQYSAGSDIPVGDRGDGDRLWDIIKRTFTP